MVPIPCLPTFAPYILGLVVDRGCDTPIESFVVHTLIVDLVGRDYKERITLFLIFLSNIPMCRYKFVLS